ncbi:MULTISPECIES: hypothetical protein [Flavobacterium]|uniref:DUF3313 domain-containing protein n=1 Tax=Flavobacterium jumunjinense TaxID=998845 RepID=A0ABV5GSK0_9FLAO|nr:MULTISPECIES: hypothetical protein [Flavobacterium]
MKKCFVLFVVSVFVVSCSIPKYVFDNKGQSTGVDFTTGKWLLNNVDAPSNVENQLTALVLKDFKGFLNDRVIPINEAKGLLLPRKINVNPDKKTLEDLKKGTNFNFFINIKASKTKEDFGSVDLTPSRFNDGGMNQSEVLLEVYDLNIAEIIYSQRVIGSTELSQDNQDVHISKSSQSLLIGAYKKLIKDIEKKSIK